MELICLRKYEKIYIFFKSIINANIYSKLSFEYFNFLKIYYFNKYIDSLKII